MVLEFADGGDLRSYLEQNFSSLTWSDKLNMATDIARGLACLHAEQIIHRDLVRILTNIVIFIMDVN